MHTPRRTPLRRTAAERGSISVFLALTAVGLILIIALAVDASGAVHTQQRARNVAAQAARAGAEQIDTAAAMQGAGASTDPAQAAAAAQTYLAAAGVSGSASVTSGTTLTVTTTDTYPTLFLSIIGINSITVHGTGTAQLHQVLNGGPA